MKVGIRVFVLSRNAKSFDCSLTDSIVLLLICGCMSVTEIFNIRGTAPFRRRIIRDRRMNCS